jgi:hypothetical protein
MAPKTELFNDAQMQDYIAKGYVLLKVDQPASFHQMIYERTEQVFEHMGNPGNNILPQIPEMQQVLDHPRVHGALTSILGADYYAHPHRHCHFNPPSSEGQGLHKDSWTRRQHRTRWAMAFYYPQDTPTERGPTGIVPGSHYYNQAPGEQVGDEIPLSGDAGTVAIVHYDLWHRAMPNATEQQRYMMKFLFVRLEEPTAPSWDCRTEEWPGGEDERMWASMWDWHRGEAANGKANGHTMDSLLDELGEENEYTALKAAYSLGAMGRTAAAPVAARLREEDERVRRNAGYALTAMGHEAVSEVVQAATAADVWTRSSAVDILGDIGLEALDTAPVLKDALSHDDQSVRTPAAHSLGTVGGEEGGRVEGLVQALADEEEWVRRYASLSLMRQGPVAKSAVDALEQAANEDESRYVQANAARALQRVGTPEAQDALMRLLFVRRWCPVTGLGSKY